MISFQASILERMEQQGTTYSLIGRGINSRQVTRCILSILFSIRLQNQRQVRGGLNHKPLRPRCSRFIIIVLLNY